MKDDARDTLEQFEEDALDWWETMWGGRCTELTEDVCSAVSYCHIEDEKFGEAGGGGTAAHVGFPRFVSSRRDF